MEVITAPAGRDAASGKGERDLGLMELLAVAVGLSMDAFAVAVCKGLAAPRLRLGHMALAGVYFGALPEGSRPLTIGPSFFCWRCWAG